MINWEENSPLVSLTHLDGRNAHKLSSLRPYFSEFAWMKLRLRVMASYTKEIAARLSGTKLSTSDTRRLQSLIDSFFLKDARAVVTIEKRVNHDLKALELYCSDSLERRGLSRLIPYLNLGIGSEDINSIALARLLKTSRGEVLIPALKKVSFSLSDLCQKEINTSMVARTHAQPANVTTFGKEVANSLSRLCDELEIFFSHSFTAKCSGEVGSYQAYLGVDPSVDWIAFTDRFIRSFGLTPSHHATQIAPYDNITRYFQSLFRINTILIDFCKNMWLYVLLGYLRVKKIEKEVGSAGMPHKVNPIYFEGAEGGLEMANGSIETFVRTLPINRLNRDFSDSTIRRNIVLPLAYSLLSYQSIIDALCRIEVDTEAIATDLKNHKEVWLETVKSYGITHGISDMYDRLKKETRGRVLSAGDLEEIVRSLPLKLSDKRELLTLCNDSQNPYPARIVEEAVGKAKRLLSSENSTIL
ncbi:MAG TPA: lyase family protein [Patescibacteria group bacterium]|uniref:Adenylosuccinate lyase n=1 Tax=Candidatus Gottesmanbacteria bacterium GW2011_GWA1_47_8 TaxID=1618438 RepID=A0A0G1TH77_9BACT|nr:MAG: Adenylosuccinate lyase [Candidatus Gottesmanbacteria bacterium GW2011_GWA1_47_8]HLD24294.1 lyase family protein [Patescibacteria group bacterium]